MAALRQFGGGPGVDEGEEVGAVVGQRAQRQLELVNEALRQFAFDGLDVALGDPLEVIPEGLAGELPGGGREQAGEDGLAIPVGELEFTGGVNRAIEGGEEEILTDGEPLVPFGEVAVEEFDEPEVLSEVVEGDNVAKGGDGHRVGLWHLGLLFFEDGDEEILRGAKVDGADDFGLAVNALAFTGVVIGLAVNDLGGKAGHAQNPPFRAAGTAGQLHIIRSYERKVKGPKWCIRTGQARKTGEKRPSGGDLAPLVTCLGRSYKIGTWGD